MKKEQEKNILKESKKKLINQRNKKLITNKNNFIKITDMTKDKKYIDANIVLKRTKANCEKAEEIALEIAQKK